MFDAFDDDLNFEDDQDFFDKLLGSKNCLNSNTSVNSDADESEEQLFRPKTHGARKITSDACHSEIKNQLCDALFSLPLSNYVSNNKDDLDIDYSIFDEEFDSEDGVMQTTCQSTFTPVNGKPMFNFGESSVANNLMTLHERLLPCDGDSGRSLVSTCMPVLSEASAGQQSSNACPIPNGVLRLTVKRKFPGPAGVLPVKKLLDCPKNSRRTMSLSHGANLDSQTKGGASGPPLSATEMNGTQVPGDELQSSKPWLTLKCDLATSNAGLEILNKFNIGFVQRKARRQSLPNWKAPLLCAVLHSIHYSGEYAAAVFRDTTGEMMGWLDRVILKEYGSYLQPGCAVVLRQMSVLSLSPRKHYLNVHHANIVCIYRESDDGGIMRHAPPNCGSLADVVHRAVETCKSMKNVVSDLDGLGVASCSTFATYDEQKLHGSERLSTNSASETSEQVSHGVRQLCHSYHGISVGRNSVPGSAQQTDDNSVLSATNSVTCAQRPKLKFTAHRSLSPAYHSSSSNSTASTVGVPHVDSLQRSHISVVQRNSGVFVTEDNSRKSDSVSHLNLQEDPLWNDDEFDSLLQQIDTQCF